MSHYIIFTISTKCISHKVYLKHFLKRFNEIFPHYVVDEFIIDLKYSLDSVKSLTVPVKVITLE